MSFRSFAVNSFCVVFCTASLATAADEPKLGKAFDAALGRVAERCEQAEVGKLLVVVRLDAAVRNAPAGLEDTIFDAAETVLKSAAEKVEVERCPVAATMAVADRARRLLSVREVHELGEAFEFDGVLAATFRVSRGSPSVRLALFDTDRRLSLEHVTVGEKTVVAAIDRFRRSDPRPSTRPTGGTLRPGPTAPNGRPTTPAGRPTAGPTPRPNSPGAGPGTTPGPGGGGNGDPGMDSGPTPPPGGEAVGLNKGVLEFAQRNFGRQVGNGECWTLANEALIAAGARKANGYTFGRGIPRGDLTPGDVLQFKSVRLERGNRFWTLGAPHHTAVVEAVAGNVVTVLHQNFGTRNVTRFTFDFGDQVQGEVHAFRPVR